MRLRFVKLPTYSQDDMAKAYKRNAVVFGPPWQMTALVLQVGEILGSPGRLVWTDIPVIEHEEDESARRNR